MARNTEISAPGNNGTKIVKGSIVRDIHGVGPLGHYTGTVSEVARTLGSSGRALYTLTIVRNGGQRDRYSTHMPQHYQVVR